MALIILVLPYSTVSIERTFSVLRQIKGTERNRLCESNLEACLLIHQTYGETYQININDLCEKYDDIWNEEAKNHDELMPNQNDSSPKIVTQKCEEVDQLSQSMIEKVRQVSKDELKVEGNNRKRKLAHSLEADQIMRIKFSEGDDYSYRSPIKIDLSQSDFIYDLESPKDFLQKEDYE